MVPGRPLMAVLALGGLLAGAGCREEPPAGALVLTQTPVKSVEHLPAATILDERYPAGSRVVLLLPPYQTNDVRVLSRGLLAAGDPVVAPDGATVYFAGKSAPAGGWQIYRARLNGGAPRRVTLFPGGAMNPGVLAGGDLVFASPVPGSAGAKAPADRTALHAQGRQATPRRLTFTPGDAIEPTVLADGRILFVTTMPGGGGRDADRLALFTVNSDGTELTAFAGQHEGGWPVVSRPRALGDGRVAFLAAEHPATRAWSRAEGVRTARPHQTRAPLLAGSDSRCRSVEPGEPGEWLAALHPAAPSAGGRGTFGIHRVRADTGVVSGRVFDDPAWHEVEAVRLVPRPEPQGHISAMAATKATGTLLCLDVNETSYPTGTATNPAVRVRFHAAADGSLRPLGEVSPQADGSFMIEAPADVPLAIEAIDETRRVVRRCPPLVWVRAGENRACVGCHEPHNRSPRNLRPLAANQPPVTLAPPARPLAQVPR